MSAASPSAIIRPASNEDMAAVAAMAGEFHAFLAAIDDGDPAFDVAKTQAKLERCGFGAEPLFACLIAEAGHETGGEPVGYAIYNIGFWADSLQGMVLVTDLFVRTAWRSRGIGKQFMDRLAEIGRDEGCEIVVWTVWTKNDAAKRFYERLGAKAIDDERLMTWRI